MGKEGRRGGEREGRGRQEREGQEDKLRKERKEGGETAISTALKVITALPFREI